MTVPLALQTAYVGSRTTQERLARGRGLATFVVEAHAAGWTERQTVDLINPSYLLVSSDGRFLHAVHGDRSEISSLAVHPDGSLRVLGCRPTCGVNPVHLEWSANGRFVVVANYATGSLASLPVEADGSLGEPVSVLSLPGVAGPLKDHQKGSHPHHIPRWPGTSFHVVPNKGLDRVHVVRVDGHGEITLVSEVSAAPGAGPRHVAFDARNPWLWVVNELDSSVTTYRGDPERGVLRALGTVALRKSASTCPNQAAGIVVHPRCSMIYVSSRGDDEVVVLSADPRGQLEVRQRLSAQGRTPRFITLTPDGQSLLVANEDTDSIVAFSIAADGLLEPGRTVARTGSPVCIVFRPAPG